MSVNSTVSNMSVNTCAEYHDDNDNHKKDNDKTVQLKN